MKSIEKNVQEFGAAERGRIANPFESKSLMVFLPGGGTLDLKNPGGCSSLNAGIDSDSLYYPLFPPGKNPAVKKKTYKLLHEKLMSEMRTQMRLKNLKKIEITGKKLHRLRKRYRTRFAA